MFFVKLFGEKKSRWINSNVFLSEINDAQRGEDQQSKCILILIGFFVLWCAVFHFRIKFKVCALRKCVCLMLMCPGSSTDCPTHF